MSNDANWQFHPGTHQGEVEAVSPRARQPIAEIHIRAYSLDHGDCSVQVRVAADGPFRDAGASGAGRQEAYQRLLLLLQRELPTALTLLGEAPCDL